MIVLMKAAVADADVQAVVDLIRERGLTTVLLPGGDHLAIGITSAIDPGVREPLANTIRTNAGVSHVVHVSRPYKLTSREFRNQSTVVNVGRASFGGPKVSVIAGPCSIESYEQLHETAVAIKEAGATILRGGAFKPRTSPYSFQGLQQKGLEILARVGQDVGLPTVTEVVDTHDVPVVAQHTDMLQIGARNMQNFALLVAAGRSDRPVLLKRGPSATIDELLFAAEYLLNEGNRNVVLCERGIHPLDRTYTRNTLDVMAVPVLKEITHLPVIVDPSHATGYARYVRPAALAGLAAGADGLIVEVHPRPHEALSDGQQSLTPQDFAALMRAVDDVAVVIRKEAS